jgi:hypothetical protein
MVTMWQEAKRYELMQEFEKHEVERLAAQVLPKQGRWKRVVAALAVVVASAAPALAIAASNGYFEEAPRPVALQTAAKPAETAAKPVLPHFVVPETVVAAKPKARPVARPVARKAPRRGPRTCKVQSVSLYGGTVLACGRPASPPERRKTGDLTGSWR